MRSMFRYKTALLAACGVMLACVAGQAYQQPAPSEPSAYVEIGRIAEDQNFTGGGAVMQIVAVDGQSTGLAESVLVAPGTHRFTVRHFDGYALFHANIKYEDISFLTQAGGDYRINGSYCCGFIFGMFDLSAYDHQSGAQVVTVTPAAPK